MSCEIQPARHNHQWSGIGQNVQKMAIFGPKLAFLVNLDQAMQAYYSVPCWWVSWWLWRAGCISQDTYLLYTICLQNCTNPWIEGWLFVQLFEKLGEVKRKGDNAAQ